MSYKILDGCIMCSACYEECLFDAIKINEENRTHYIEKEACVECDRCSDVCPVDLVKRDETTESRRRFSSINIIEEKCIGCSLCARVCPVKAITGEIKKPFKLDQNLCIKCGQCVAKCKKDAFEVGYID